MSGNGKLIACSYPNRGTNGLVKVFTQCLISYDSINIVACDSFKRSSNGKIYYQNDRYIDTLLNASLCDSIVEVNLTIQSSSPVTQLYDTACLSYFWHPANRLLDSSGVYYHTLTNKDGCDSVLKLNLVIYQSSSTMLSITECDSYYWKSTDERYAVSGIYQDTLFNQYGCDSLISLELTIPDINTEVMQDKNRLFAIQVTDYEYQWVRCGALPEKIMNQTNWEFVTDTLGSFALEVSYLGCKDISDCYEVTYIPYLDCKLTKPSLIYPNPTNGSFTIKLCELFPFVTAQLLTIEGKLVYENQFFETSIINLSLNVSKGMYLLKLSAEKETKILKVVIY
jgi:hypothetical protein